MAVNDPNWRVIGLGPTTSSDLLYGMLIVSHDEQGVDEAYPWPLSHFRALTEQRMHLLCKPVSQRSFIWYALMQGTK